MGVTPYGGAGGTAVGTLLASNNLSDVGSAATSRNNLGALAIQPNINTVATSGAAQTIPDPTAAPYYEASVITLSAACTLTFPTAAAGKKFRLEVLQPNAGGTYNYAITWPGSALIWTGGVPPSQGTGQGALVVYAEFECLDGTNWLGTYVSSQRGLLAAGQYGPGSTTTYTSNPGSGLHAIDSTNITVSFVATSTQALVSLHILAKCTDTAFNNISWVLLNHGTTTQVPNSTTIDDAIQPNADFYWYRHYHFLVTGLTVGTTYTWDFGWAYETGASGVANALVHGVTGDNDGSVAAPALWTVEAA